MLNMMCIIHVQVCSSPYKIFMNRFNFLLSTLKGLKYKTK